LACSLHEIAMILGPQMAEKELLTVLDQVLKDTSDDIKYGTIANLWKFLSVFETERREHLLDVFLLLQKDQKKWRVRELIACQLHELARIFSPQTVFDIIVPISMKLCNDIVSCVRK
jgi:serine/threonine-protein phosphatase 4 regulatory subunit 1